jgi:hypothetical protein
MTNCVLSTYFKRWETNKTICILLCGSGNRRPWPPCAHARFRMQLHALKIYTRTCLSILWRQLLHQHPKRRGSRRYAAQPVVVHQSMLPHALAHLSTCHTSAPGAGPAQPRVWCWDQQPRFGFEPKAHGSQEALLHHLSWFVLSVQ